MYINIYVCVSPAPAHVVRVFSQLLVLESVKVRLDLQPDDGGRRIRQVVLFSLRIHCGGTGSRRRRKGTMDGGSEACALTVVVVVVLVVVVADDVTHRAEAGRATHGRRAWELPSDVRRTVKLPPGSTRRKMLLLKGQS